MYTVGTWATQVEIYAMDTMLQRGIYILSPCGEDYRWLMFKPQFAHNMLKRLDEFEFQPDPHKDYGVTCPCASEKSMFHVVNILAPPF